MNAAGQTGPVSSLAWLEGTWERTTRTLTTTEVWLSPISESMVGMSRTVMTNGRTAHEFMVIATDSAGRVIFTASPSGQVGGSFPAVTVTDRLAVFENPAHDFPQRIVYRRVTADSIHARIEGTMNGRASGVDFFFRRAGR